MSKKNTASYQISSFKDELEKFALEQLSKDFNEALNQYGYQIESFKSTRANGKGSRCLTIRIKSQ